MINTWYCTFHSFKMHSNKSRFDFLFISFLLYMFFMCEIHEGFWIAFCEMLPATLLRPKASLIAVIFSSGSNESQARGGCYD